MLAASVRVIGVSVLAGEPPDPAAARAAVVKSLPWLEKDGVAWLDERECRLELNDRVSGMYVADPEARWFVDHHHEGRGQRPQHRGRRRGR